jgi:hypothetical protein
LKLETPFQLKYRMLREVLTLDKKYFKICEIKEKEIGIFKKRFLYIHFDGKQWSILRLDSDLSAVGHWKIES